MRSGYPAIGWIAVALGMVALGTVLLAVVLPGGEPVDTATAMPTVRQRPVRATRTQFTGPLGSRWLGSKSASRLKTYLFSSQVTPHNTTPTTISQPAIL
jgi:hypothetical protein